MGTFFAVGRAFEVIPLGELNCALADRIDSHILKAVAMFSLGGALTEQDPDRARELFRASAEHGRAAHMEYQTAMALARLARMTGTQIDEAWARDFRTAVDLSVDSGDPRTFSSLLELFGQVLAAHDRPEPAVLALSHWASTSADANNPVSRIAIERWRHVLLEDLGDARYEQLWTQGSLMTPNDAITLMRSELDRVLEP
jgi:hypothetical protein